MYRTQAQPPSRRPRPAAFLSTLRVLRGVVVAGLALTLAACPSPVPESGNFAGGDASGAVDSLGAADATAMDASDVSALDAGGPDTGVPDTGIPDTGIPDTGIPDTGVPDTGTPDTGAPDAGAPDAGAPDAGAPDAGAPDSGSSCPGGCDDGNPCTTDACAATCTHVPLADGAACGAGQVCALGHCLLAQGWATTLAAGYSYACAAAGKDVRCWGENTKGQLGGGAGFAFGGVQAPYTVPGVGLAHVVQVATTQQHVCAVGSHVSGGSRAVCWGDNFYGQVGPGGTSVPSPAMLAGSDGATHACTGTKHTCVRKSDGTVWCLGLNGDSQLGDGGGVGKSTKLVQVKGIDDALDVACGSTHTCAIRGDRSLWCWGDNEFGAVTATVGAAAEIAKPTAVPGLPPVAAARLGDRVSCVRTVGKGAVLCWGRNTSGQLGDGTQVASVTPVVAFAGGARDLHVNQSTACVVDTQGAVWCWGNNSFQLVAPKATQPSNVVTKAIKRSDVSGVHAVSVGHSHVCVQLTTGAVKCWGAGGAGQLGNDNDNSSATAVLVKGSS